MLFDTNILLWAALDDPRMPAAARAALSRDNCRFSPISIYEVGIKSARGRPDFVVDPGVFRRYLSLNRFDELPLVSDHATAAAKLDPIHKDPFDRLLVAQAIVEGMPLMTADRTLAGYGAAVIVV